MKLYTPGEINPQKDANYKIQSSTFLGVLASLQTAEKN